MSFSVNVDMSFMILFTTSHQTHMQDDKVHMVYCLSNIGQKQTPKGFTKDVGCIAEVGFVISHNLNITATQNINHWPTVWYVKVMIKIAVDILLYCLTKTIAKATTLDSKSMRNEKLIKLENWQ